MSLYADPMKYARMVRLPLSLAKTWCEKQLKIENEIEKARVCPTCQKATLEYETGDYEAGTTDYIYCSNDEIQVIDEDGEPYFTECDFVSDPQKQFEPLMIGYDFDFISALSWDNTHSLKQFNNLLEWVNYAKVEITKS
jgi:hypothetical protein